MTATILTVLLILSSAGPLTALVALLLAWRADRSMKPSAITAACFAVVYVASWVATPLIG